MRLTRLIVLVAVAAVCLVAPMVAVAAPSAPASRLSFGDPFYSSNPSALPFQTQVLTPSADNIAEATSPACIAPAGSPVAGRLVPDTSLSRLRIVIREAELILVGEGLAETYGEDGERAYADFINAVRQGKYRDANRIRSGDQFNLNGDQDGEPDPFVNALVNPTATATNQVRANIPANCNFDAGQDVADPEFGFGSIFGDPGGFMLDLLLWVGAKPASVAYNWLAPMTFQYSFFTPHSERGETIFDIVGADQQIVRQYGFDPSLKTDAVAATGSAAWLTLAVWLRAVLSGFYILILIAAALLYMVRGPVANKLNALKLAPRILLSVILTLAIPTLIGLAITLSNLITAELFRSDPTCVERVPGAGNCDLARQVNGVLQQGNYDLSQISNNIEAGVFQLISVNASALFYGFFAAVAVMRQLALIALVTLAPVACFMIIFERHQEWFSRWAKAIIAICLIPVGMALILRIGLALNPTAGLLTTAPPTGSASSAISMPERILALVIMLCTFYFMAKVPRMLKGWVTGNQGASAGVQLLRGMGGRLSGSANPAMAAAGRGMGSVAGGADMTNRAVGRLVPGDSHENRALPSASMRSKVLSRIAGGDTEAAAGGVVQAVVAGAGVSARRGIGAGDDGPRPGGLPTSGPAAGAGAPSTGRRELDRGSYMAMVGEQAQSDRADREEGLPPRPHQWRAERDDNGYWATENPDYEREMRDWNQRVERIRTARDEGGIDVGADSPVGAEGPTPDIGGPGPRLEVPGDPAPGAPSAGAAPPGTLVGSSSGRLDGDPGAGLPPVGAGGGPRREIDSDGWDAPGVGAVGASEIAQNANVVAGGLSGADRPRIEPVSSEELDGLFDPVEVPQVDVTSGIERALTASVDGAGAQWEAARDSLLGGWREGFEQLGETQQDHIRSAFAEFRLRDRESFGHFVSELQLEGVHEDDPGLAMAWSDWDQERALSPRRPL